MYLEHLFRPLLRLRQDLCQWSSTVLNGILGYACAQCPTSACACRQCSCRRIRSAQSRNFVAHHDTCAQSPSCGCMIVAARLRFFCAAHSCSAPLRHLMRNPAIGINFKQIASTRICALKTGVWTRQLTADRNFICKRKHLQNNSALRILAFIA